MSYMLIDLKKNHTLMFKVLKSNFIYDQIKSYL